MSKMDKVLARLSPDAAGARIGVTAKTLANWRVSGTGPAYYRVSASLVVYDADDIDAWMASRRFISTSAEKQAA